MTHQHENTQEKYEKGALKSMRATFDESHIVKCEQLKNSKDSREKVNKMNNNKRKKPKIPLFIFV